MPHPRVPRPMLEGRRGATQPPRQLGATSRDLTACPGAHRSLRRAPWIGRLPVSCQRLLSPADRASPPSPAVAQSGKVGTGRRTMPPGSGCGCNPSIRSESVIAAAAEPSLSQGAERPAKLGWATRESRDEEGRGRFAYLARCWVVRRRARASGIPKRNLQAPRGSSSATGAS